MCIDEYCLLVISPIEVSSALYKIWFLQIAQSDLLKLKLAIHLYSMVDSNPLFIPMANAIIWTKGSDSTMLVQSLIN